jgi:predicted adenylyl cyclase CyaB
MKEIEILTQVFDDKEKVVKILEKFNFVGVKKTLDIYFFDPLRSDLKPDVEGCLNNCFRLRKKDDKSFLAYKIDRFDENKIWLYSDEHEVEVFDFEKIIEILKHLGLEILVEVENQKYTYLTDKYEIVFEEVKNLGLFFEVEYLQAEDVDDVIKIKKEIWNFIKSLDIKVGEELNVGKPELMLKRLKNK